MTILNRLIGESYCKIPDCRPFSIFKTLTGCRPYSHSVLEKYKQIVVSNCKEPGMDGNFDDCTKEVLKELEDDDSDTDEEVQSNTDSEI